MHFRILDVHMCTTFHFYEHTVDYGRADRVDAAGGVRDGVRDHLAGDPLRDAQRFRLRHAGRDDRARLLAHVRRV